ncbi:winged helix DNA-binding domain-containing protein [Pseudonocardia sp. TRM90224]|uniref:winged helix DNA-binding domain-containing protein n=1 Tax=Pseudonocardia sp. TRM90224 TaxID=2812678 RepID=UPI001E288D72|nr:winged helix DNA-binding domain-containing protein [Pseudonocardia sp. TRM90224]
MTERVLSTRELNRAVLARQLLLERSTSSLVSAVEQVACLQTQYSPSGYVGLWSRLAGFEREALTAALLDGSIVQGWAMRCTIHMLSAADYAPLVEAVREPRQEWFRRAWKADDIDMQTVADAVRGYLADGPLKQAELQKRLVADGHPKAAWPGVQLWIDLVRVPPAGTWGTPRAHVYGLAEHTITLPQPRPTLAEGCELLVTRYLGGFGPASVKDVGSFCGWKLTETREVLERMELRRFRDEAGGVLFDLPEAPLPDPETPAPVRFIGQWDAVLLVHARRGQILPEHYRQNVFATSMPQSIPTFLVDGQVAGTWKFVDGEISCSPFHELDDPAADAVAAEAGRLARLYTG